MELNNKSLSSTLKPVIAAIEALADAADEYTRQHTAAVGSSDETQLRIDIHNDRIIDLKAERKALKPPRKSRSKKPAMIAATERRRLDVLVDREVLGDFIDDESTEIKMLANTQATAERINNGERVNMSKAVVVDSLPHRFAQSLRHMKNGVYRIQPDGSKAIPNYNDVSIELGLALVDARSSSPNGHNAEWLAAVDEFFRQAHGYERILTAIALMGANGRAVQHPHRLERAVVFDGVGNSEWEMDLKEYVESNTIGRQRGNALRCSQLTNDYQTIQNVSTVIDTAMPSIRTDGEAEICNVFLSAPMGGVYNTEVNGHVHNSGSKTDGIMLPVIESGLANGHYITVIVHRVTLTHDISARVTAFIERHSPAHSGKVWHYGDNLITNNPRVLVVCINSLTKPFIAEFVQKSNVVIVDEFTQVLDNIHTTIEKGGKPRQVESAVATFGMLMDAIGSKSTTFIALDADMESGTIERIKQHTGTQPSTATFNIPHPERQLPASQRRKQAIFHRDTGEHGELGGLVGAWRDERLDAKHEFSQNSRFFIATDSLSISTAIAASLTTDGLSVCLINADTKGRADVRAVVNGAQSPDDYDVVVYSPSITSGVSWTSTNYTRGVVIATGVVPANYLKQMMFRFRCTDTVHVFNENITWGDHSPPVDMEREDRIKTLALKQPHGALYMAVRAHRRELADESTKKQLQYLAYQADAEGWGLSVIDPTAGNNGVIEYGSDRAVKIDRAYRNRAVMNSPQFTFDEYKQAKNSSMASETTTAYSTERFESAVYGAISDHEYDIKLWLDKQVRGAVGRIQANLLWETETAPMAFAGLDWLMTSMGITGWWNRLQRGEEIKIASKEVLAPLLKAIADPKSRNLLYALGAFDRCRESNRVGWVRASGALINDNMAVVSQDKIRRQRYWRHGNLPLIDWAQRRVKPPYVAYPLFDGNVLVMNTKPKDGSLGGAVVRQLFRQCGIPVTSDHGATIVDEKKAKALINVAKRRRLARRITARAEAAAQLFGAVTYQLWTDTTGFKVTVRRDGTVEITATADVLARVTEGRILTRSGVVVEGVTIEAANADSLNEFLLGSTQLLPQTADAALMAMTERHNPQQKQLLSDNGTIICTRVGMEEKSGTDVFLLLLPALLADENLVDSGVLEERNSAKPHPTELANSINNQPTPQRPQFC